jgi:hypothetical protein
MDQEENICSFSAEECRAPVMFALSLVAAAHGLRPSTALYAVTRGDMPALPVRYRPGYGILIFFS